MMIAPTKPQQPSGATLIEAVIAIGVLAVAIPLAFGTMAEAGKTGAAAEAETRSTWIIPACMDEIHAARDGKPQFFSPTHPGAAFPPAGQIWALGFSDEGKPVGKLDKPLYEKGTSDIDGVPIRYIAIMTAETPPADDPSPLLKVRISVEHPANAPAAKRRNLDFHTRIP